MTKIGIYKYKVEPCNLDFMNRPTIVSIIDSVLDAAGEDANAKGFGVRDLNAAECSWVISRMALELNRYPQPDETYFVETWVSEVNRLMSVRNMRIVDENDAEIGSAATNWAMINIQSRRPMNLTSHEEYMNAVVDRGFTIPVPAKIGTITPSSLCSHTVSYSDLDFNRHANSLRYLSWMLDLLPIEYHTDHLFRRLDINYMQEILLGETVEIGLEMREGRTLFDIRHDSVRDVCRACIEWK